MEDNMKKVGIHDNNSDQVNFKNTSLELVDFPPQKNMEVNNLESIKIDNNPEKIDSESVIERDPFGKVDQKSSTFQASMNLLKSYVGGGILALPYIFFKTGYLLATFAMILTAALVYYSTLLLLELVADSGNKPVNVSEVFNRVLGRKASIIYKFFLGTYQMGICISYAIFFTDFFQVAFGTENIPSMRIIFACFSLVIILPLSMINNFHFFMKFSNIGNLLILITLIAIIQLDFTHLYTKQLNFNEHNFGTFTHLPSFIGVSIFAFECIGNIFPVKNSMKEPEKFKKMFSITSIVVCLVYIVFSVICCVSLGVKINQIILTDLEKIQSFFYIFQTFYAVALILSYPIQFYPLVIILEDNYVINKYITTKGKYNWKRYVVRFIVTLIIFVLAFAIPKFASFLNLVGAFAGINLQFVFPIIAYYSVFKLMAPKWKINLNFAVLVFGVIGSGFGIYDSIKEMSEK